MIQNFKRGNSLGVGFTYPHPSEAKVAKLREESGSGLPKDGVIHEQPRVGPKKSVWVPKPN